jgi:hypothetical protein
MCGNRVCPLLEQDMSQVYTQWTARVASRPHHQRDQFSQAGVFWGYATTSHEGQPGAQIFSRPCSSSAQRCTTQAATSRITPDVRPSFTNPQPTQLPMLSDMENGACLNTWPHLTR